MNVLYMTQEGLMVHDHSPAEEFPALIEPEVLLLYLQKSIIRLHHTPLESNLFAHTQFP
jgi:hypothetical protein